MEAKHKMILTGVIVAVLVSCPWLAFLAHRKAAEIRYYSDMCWVDAALREGLDNYYKANNRYPEKLTELQIDFTGADQRQKMLHAFAYSTDGKRYEITWVVKYEGKLHIQKSRGAEAKRSSRETTYIDL